MLFASTGGTDENNGQAVEGIVEKAAPVYGAKCWND